MVKGGKYLEAFAEADTIVFDKTGTPHRRLPPGGGGSGLHRPGGGRAAAVRGLHRGALPPQHGPGRHPRRRGAGLNHEERHAEVEYVVAHGVATTLEGERALIGSRHFIFEDEGVACTDEQARRIAAAARGRSVLYLAIGGRLAGVLLISDPPRPEAAEAIAALRALGCAG